VTETSFQITVDPVPIVLDSIAVTTEPDITIYTEGETLDLTGMVVTATYSDGSTAVVTGYVTDPAEGGALNETGQQMIIVSYTEDSVTKTTSFYVTVNAAQQPPAPVVRYTITATSDSGSRISPYGSTEVTRGGDMTFTFSARSGYALSEVYVDGSPISSEDVSSGTYTFRNVTRDHTIYATSEELIVLTITVVSGLGYAEYSIDGSEPVEYTSTLMLPYDADVVITAHPGVGHSFSHWWYDNEMYLQQEKSFDNVTSSLHLEVYFIEEGFGDSQEANPSGLWPIIPAIIAGLGLLLFFIFWRRYYEVVPPEGMEAVDGRRRAHRRSEYRYRMPDAYSGPMAYRIGDDEDNEWKPVLREGDHYVIPAGEITDKVYLRKCLQIN
jgi:hypothetical protein